MIVIYKIFNKINGKFYIGSAVEDTKRWREHQYHLNRKTHKNIHLQNAWNKYKSEAFEFVILEILDNKLKLLNREQFYLDSLKPNYNMALIAGSRLGVPMPQSAKDKIGENSKRHMTGRKILPQTREALSKANRERIRPKGYKQSPETIAKRIASNTGKTRTAETKAKMSAAKMGKIVSEETKRKQSEAAKVRWKSHRAIEQ